MDDTLWYILWSVVKVIIVGIFLIIAVVVLSKPVD